MLSDAAIAGSKYISGANMANARYRGARYAGPGQAIKNFKGFDKGYSWGSRSNNTQYGGAGPKTAAQASYLSKNVYSNL